MRTAGPSLSVMSGARDRYKRSPMQQDAAEARRRRAQLEFQDWTATHVIRRALASDGEHAPKATFRRAVVDGWKAERSPRPRSSRPAPT
jgi:hypothetical protein